MKRLAKAEKCLQSAIILFIYLIGPLGIHFTISKGSVDVN